MSNLQEQTRLGRPRAAVAPYKQALLGFSGGFCAIGLLGLLGHLSGAPLLIAPFGASSVLLFAAPESPFALPRNLVLGHLIATLVGLCIFMLAGSGLWQMALSVGLAIGLMQITRSVHPPAGADPLVIMLGGTATPMFLLFPVLIGVLLLLAIALLFNNFFRDQRWPARWH